MSNIKLFDVGHLNVECQTTNIKPTLVQYKEVDILKMPEKWSHLPLKVLGVLDTLKNFVFNSFLVVVPKKQPLVAITVETPWL